MGEETSSSNKCSEIWLDGFAKGRLKEMLDLKEKVKRRRGQLPSQRVPHHMRRRAVSHNPNRLPQRLRDKHSKERISGGAIDASKPKRPNRRFRRRPAQLLDEYNRRQFNNGIWLETHIWHAKRFRMTPSKWGMRLPDTPNDKGYRLVYRANKSKSVMFDLSYFRLYELTTEHSQDTLVKGINSLLPPKQALQSIPHSYIHLPLYEPNQYPYGYIGAISIHALPKKDSLESIWLWVHPSYADKVLETLKTLFAIEDILIDTSKEDASNTSGTENSSSKAENPVDNTEIPKEETLNPEPVAKKTKVSVNEAKLAPRNIPFSRVPKFKGPEVTLNDLSSCINRYRLIGPHADRILTATLQLSSIEMKEKYQFWWSEYYKKDQSSSSFVKQVDFWKDNCSLQRIPGNINMVSLTIRDPRILLPPKRSVIPDQKIKKMDESIPDFPNNSDFHNSPLWDPEIRDKVSFSKCPDHTINEKRSKLLVPGSQIPLSDSESRVPIVLLRRKYGSEDCDQGWDVLSPPGWGMPLWMCFVMYGARTGGQTEIRNCDFERGVLDVLRASPDSPAGVKEAQESALLDKELYFRYPPDKRCNFKKTGFDSPFLPKWKYLINDWIQEDIPLVKHSKNKLKPNDEVIPNFYVLRDSELLLKLSQNQNEVLEDPKCLIPISLSIIGKGTISRNAGIFIPTDKDMDLFRSEEENRQYVTEPLQDDKQEACLRTSLKSEHNAKKINLRRKWKKVKDKLAYLRQKNLTDKNLDEEIQKCQNSLSDLKKLRDKEILEFEVQMQTLWLDPEEATSFKDSSTRPVCGYVLNANFSLRKGGHVGLGFVAYSSMKHFNKDNILLIRDNSSLQYRFVKMSIIEANDSI